MVNRKSRRAKPEGQLRDLSDQPIRSRRWNKSDLPSSRLGEISVAFTDGQALDSLKLRPTSPRPSLSFSHRPHLDKPIIQFAGSQCMAEGGRRIARSPGPIDPGSSDSVNFKSLTTCLPLFLRIHLFQGVALERPCMGARMLTCRSMSWTPSYCGMTVLMAVGFSWRGNSNTLSNVMFTC